MTTINIYDTAALDAGIVKKKTSEFVNSLLANIPLGPPDKEYDPNDQFRAAARDRYERAVTFKETLFSLLDPKTKYSSGDWAYLLGVEVIDRDGWKGRHWQEEITREEFLDRMSVSTVSLHSWSVLRAS